MCFGERTTFVCPIAECINKHWETEWYAFGADPESGKCAAGNVLGTCSDPCMVYHLEAKVCTECHFRLNEGTPLLPPTTETWHPQDHHHSYPPIPNYERSETDTAITTGRLTGPMLVARELNRQLPDGGTTVFQRNVPEIQLVDQINDIISRRNTDATDNMEEDLPAPPTTPVRPPPPAEIPPGVFQDPIPQTALNDTPLPAYSQVASRGHAPLFSEYDPMDIPVNLCTLQRLSDHTYYLPEALSDDLRTRLLDVSSAANTAIQMPYHYDVAKMQKIADAAKYLREGSARLRNEAHDRRKIVFEHSTTSATFDQVADWIVEITRNPENSVRSHARRFTAWIWLLEHEIFLTVSPNDRPDYHKFPDGSTIPGYLAINFAFEQEEVCDQMVMQGDVWDESSSRYVERTRQQIHADKAVVAELRRRDRAFPSIYYPTEIFNRGDEELPHWHGEFGKPPLRADTRTPIRVHAAFSLPNPRPPLPGPNDSMEVSEIDTALPREVVDLTGDSPDAMETD
ncbi:hypothetical protein KCU92_g2838, partial [Aureobasidium melanogenum]